MPTACLFVAARLLGGNDTASVRSAQLRRWRIGGRRARSPDHCSASKVSTLQTAASDNKTTAHATPQCGVHPWESLVGVDLSRALM